MGNVGIWDPPSSVCFRMCERPSLNGMRSVETTRSSSTAADHDNFVFVLLKLIYHDNFVFVILKLIYKLINFTFHQTQRIGNPSYSCFADDDNDDNDDVMLGSSNTTIVKSTFTLLIIIDLPRSEPFGKKELRHSRNGISSVNVIDIRTGF